ncbi:MAG: mutator protein MutT [Desulforhopalus sp.]|jgi:mutator protein MutT
MLDVTAAIIQRDGQILAARRKPGAHMAGFWEFPGGKVESGESPEECICRELKEELDIETKIGPFFGESCYDYGTKEIRLLCYRVNYLSGTFTLTDHDEIRWLPIDQLLSLKWAPADIPLVKKLVRLKM